MMLFAGGVFFVCTVSIILALLYPPKTQTFVRRKEWLGEIARAEDAPQNPVVDLGSERVARALREASDSELDAEIRRRRTSLEERRAKTPAE